MAITVITEQQAASAEYFYDIIMKVREILYENRAILKAGDKIVGDRIYYGVRTAVPETPAIQIEGSQDDERYDTLGPVDEITFTVHIWCLHIYLDSEQNEREIHQLGDRIKEVLRQNAEIDGLALDSRPVRARYGVQRTYDGGFIRAGDIEFSITKYVGG